MTEKTRLTIKYAAIILFFLMLTGNFCYLSVNNLHPDEAYYWAWSQSLDIGYFDNSPFVAYLIRFFTSIGGNNEFWVRFPAFLTWVFIMGFIYQFTKTVYRKKNPAYLALLIALFVPLMITGSHIMTHDIPLILFSIPTWYFLYRAIEREEKKAWYWAGLFLGLALFSKFQAGLIGIATLVMVILRPSKRKLLLHKEPYLAVAIALLCFAPVLYWNWQHGWAAFAWQTQHGIHQTIELKNLAEFLARQLGVFSLLFLALIYYSLKRLIKFNGTTGNEFFLLGCFLPIFLFFTYTSLTFPAEANWPAVAYFPAIVFLAGQMYRTWQLPGSIKNTLLTVFMLLTFAVSGLLVSLVRYPDFFINVLRIKLPSAAVMTNSTYGWSQLGKRVGQTIAKLYPNRKTATPVFADSYQLAAELDFYTSKPAAVFTTRQAHRNHYEYRTIARIAKFNRQSGLLVLEHDLPANASRYFSGIAFVGTVTTRRFGADIREVSIYSFTTLNALALYEMAVHKPLGYPGTYPD
jgi:4-amino-4-deoxy-L-arabinose transferase-like glycosyltransferase